MRKDKAIKKEINKIRKKLRSSPAEQGAVFSYWVGYLRALEWTMNQENKNK